MPEPAQTNKPTEPKPDPAKSKAVSPGPPPAPPAAGQSAPPPGTAAQQEVMQTMTHYEGLRQIGFIKGIDFLVGIVLGLSTVVLVCWIIFARPEAVRILVALYAQAMLVIVWLVILVFRTMHFVLMLRADINLMPFSAGRIAASFLSGQSLK